VLVRSRGRAQKKARPGSGLREKKIALPQKEWERIIADRRTAKRREKKLQGGVLRGTVSEKSKKKSRKRPAGNLRVS